MKPGDGTIDREVVREVARAALPTFEAATARARLAPKLGEWLGLRFHQTEKGKQSSEAESRFPDECVTFALARALAFPKPTGGEVASVVPLRFSSSRGAQRRLGIKGRSRGRVVARR